MKRYRLVIVLVLIGLILTFSAVMQAKDEPATPTYKMSLMMLHGEKVGEWEWVIVLNGSFAFKSVKALELYLEKEPKGTKLEWWPSCLCIGKEPLLTSKDEMNKFEEFCEEHGIEFILHPSG